MKIAVLSGKGGTGKTLVSTNLSNIMSKNSTVQLFDCDVEEPNSHIFFNIDYNSKKEVNTLIPVVNNDICIHCGKCAQSCQFGAISAFPTGTVVFESLCHGCGTCKDVCPVNAITEKEKSMGIIRFGKDKNKNIYFGEGILNIGEPSGVRVIRELKLNFEESDFIILDSPPGASCPVVETLRDVDYAILVTESTPFGLHDLKIAHEVVQEMQIKCGIVINRYDENFKDVEEFASKNNIEVLAKIPFDRQIAIEYSKGNLISDKFPKYHNLFEDIAKKVAK